jgi:hypothetical protein
VFCDVDLRANGTSCPYAFDHGRSSHLVSGRCIREASRGRRTSVGSSPVADLAIKANAAAPASGDNGGAASIAAPSAARVSGPHREGPAAVNRPDELQIPQYAHSVPDSAVTNFAIRFRQLALAWQPTRQAARYDPLRQVVSDLRVSRLRRIVTHHLAGIGRRP